MRLPRLDLIKVIFDDRTPISNLDHTGWFAVGYRGEDTEQWFFLKNEDEQNQDISINRLLTEVVSDAISYPIAVQVYRSMFPGLPDYLGVINNQQTKEAK